MLFLLKVKAVINTIYTFLKEHLYLIKNVCIVVLVAVAGYLLWEHFNPPQTVTVTTQEQAESIQGVQNAASNANVPVSTSQAKEIATTIKEIRTTEQVPVYVVQTTGAEASAASEQARQDAKADFAIVTGKDNDDVQNLDDIPKDTKVELNQYNINAYKKVIRQIEVGHGTNGNNEVGFTINKKITNDGKYIGIGISDEFGRDGNTVWAKVVYSW